MAGIAYVAAENGHVLALDTVDGSVVWDRESGGPILNSPAVAGGLVYVGSTDKRLLALDAATGTTAWSVNPGAGINSPAAVADGVVYVGTRDHVVHAYDAATGSEFWQASSRRHRPSGVAVDEDSVFVTSFSSETGPHEVLSLDAATGRRRWTVTVDELMVYPPVVANGVVYVVGWDDRLYAIDAARGEILFESEAQSNGGFVTPSISDGVVYAPNGGDYRLWAFEGSASP
jgi:outer membrane protein assembly factor BamB